MKLRGHGPRIFISYAFGNDDAVSVAQQLEGHGFRVTLVDSRTLLTEPSLKSAIEELVEAAEIVVPVLDKQASKSSWVLTEIDLALQSGSILIPVVVDEAGLPASVQDIPWIPVADVAALPSAILSKYLCLPLDVSEPFHFVESQLRTFLETRTEPLRIVLDAGDFTGSLAERAPECIARATGGNAMMQAAIEKQVAETITRCQGELDRVQEICPAYKATVSRCLTRYGPEMAVRSVRSWQALGRLVVGGAVLSVARTLPPSSFPELWGESGQGVESASKEAAAIAASENDRGVRIWALSDPTAEPQEWFDVEFTGPPASEPTRAMLPKKGRFEAGAGEGKAPESYIEPYEWADFVVPQLASRAARLAHRFSEPEILASLRLGLQDYSRSGLP